jgi:hypothetical protein
LDAQRDHGDFKQRNPAVEGKASQFGYELADMSQSPQNLSTEMGAVDCQLTDAVDSEKNPLQV